MTFQISEDGFEAETSSNEMYFIPFDIIQRISMYSSDLFSGEELRLEFETTDYEIYTFSEREDCWLDLLAWLQDWANLPEDWQNSEFDEAFSNELTLLWQLTD